VSRASLKAEGRVRKLAPSVTKPQPEQHHAPGISDDRQTGRTRDCIGNGSLMKSLGVSTIAEDHAATPACASDGWLEDNPARGRLMGAQLPAPGAPRCAFALPLGNAVPNASLATICEHDTC
jgi:hypothetical protein